MADDKKVLSENNANKGIACYIKENGIIKYEGAN